MSCFFFVFCIIKVMFIILLMGGFVDLKWDLYCWMMFCLMLFCIWFEIVIILVLLYVILVF